MLLCHSDRRQGSQNRSNMSNLIRPALNCKQSSRLVEFSFHFCIRSSRKKKIRTSSSFFFHLTFTLFSFKHSTCPFKKFAYHKEKWIIRENFFFNLLIVRDYNIINVFDHGECKSLIYRPRQLNYLLKILKYRLPRKSCPGRYDSFAEKKKDTLFSEPPHRHFSVEFLSVSLSSAETLNPVKPFPLI